MTILDFLTVFVFLVSYFVFFLLGMLVGAAALASHLKQQLTKAGIDFTSNKPFPGDEWKHGKEKKDSDDEGWLRKQLGE